MVASGLHLPPGAPRQDENTKYAVPNTVCPARSGAASLVVPVGMEVQVVTITHYVPCDRRCPLYDGMERVVLTHAEGEASDETVTRPRCGLRGRSG